ncbi:MAG: aspartate-semialdehyde dehydrogenase [Oscillospiraceae bacterium]|nr:aspartate-semialdehyde dehydrogenase [Oscillospiraceae bacterium]
MKQYKVGILGATGSVGREMMKILLEREFPVSELHLFASERSAGKVVAWNGRPIQIELASDDAFKGLDIVLGAAENDVAKRFAPAIVKAGAVFIDNSSAFRLREDVPLVVPEVNGEDVFNHRGIIANPNCSTIIAVTAINALRQLSPIVSIVASTYQAVSGAGAAGPVELSEQVSAVMKGQPVQPKVFPYPIAFNLIPQIGSEQESGYTSEEMKLQYEGQKILHLPALRVSCTCVRVPVMRSHSLSLTLRFHHCPTVFEARRAIQRAPGCKLVDDLGEGQYPMPLDTSDQDLVFVGRIRPDLTDEDGLCLWCCGDQIRKGAATNAVQIAELLINGEG